MPGLSTKVQRLTQVELNQFYSTCRHCKGRGWLHVAYSLNDEAWSVYKFPCRCQDGAHGLEITEVLTDNLYNRPPDYTTADLPGYVYIHPRLNHIKAKQLGNHISKRKQELGLDQVDGDFEFPF